MLERLNIVALQKADHLQLQAWMRDYDAASVQGKRALYRCILRLVTTHAFAEETVLFPAARRLLPRAEAVTSDIEGKHQRINELMVELDGLSPGETEFELRMAALFALLLADLSEEEDVLLRRLSQRLSSRQLSALGATWLAVKATAPTRPHPRVSRRPPGNALAALPLSIADRTRDLLDEVRHR